MGNFPAVLNFNRLFLKLNQFILNHSSSAMQRFLWMCLPQPGFMSNFDSLVFLNKTFSELGAGGISKSGGAM